MRASVEAAHSLPLGAVGERLRALAEQTPTTAGAIAALARDFALLHVEALRALLGDRPIDLVCAHGQTVYHAPPLSWQLLNPAPIVAALRVPLVCDLRAADLAAGGQGAPITPIADFVLFRHPQETRAVLNLGGFCNFSLIPAGARSAADLLGGDICACNHVLNALARRRLHTPFDNDGQAALRGAPVAACVELLGGLLRDQSGAGRSLGTGDELIAALNDAIAQCATNDALRSACEAIAAAISRRLPAVDRVIVAGGGARNQALFRAIGEHTDAPVSLSDEFGVSVSSREASAMAVLGALCRDRVPITIPAVTRVPAAPLAGVWAYP